MGSPEPAYERLGAKVLSLPDVIAQSVGHGNLTAEQLKRLQQLELQQQGRFALGRPEIAKAVAQFVARGRQ